MKTTVEIPDPLLREARRLADREGTTMRALIEEALRRLLVERRRRGEFRLRRASYRGEGLRPELKGAGWEELRRRAYEERGG